MSNERGLGKLAEHADRALVGLRTEQLASVQQDRREGWVSAHMDRAGLLAGQRYLKKEYGSASAKVAKADSATIRRIKLHS